MHVCMYVFMYVCMYVCMYVSIYVCMDVTSSLPNHGSDRKTDYAIEFVRVQGWLLGQLEAHNGLCVLLITKKKTLVRWDFTQHLHSYQSLIPISIN